MLDLRQGEQVLLTLMISLNLLVPSFGEVKRVNLIYLKMLVVNVVDLLFLIFLVVFASI